MQRRRRWRDQYDSPYSENMNVCAACIYSVALTAAKSRWDLSAVQCREIPSCPYRMVEQVMSASEAADVEVRNSTSAMLRWKKTLQTLLLRGVHNKPPTHRRHDEIGRERQVVPRRMGRSIIPCCNHENQFVRIFSYGIR